MAACAQCGVEILFGGVKMGDLRYCGRSCHEKAEKVQQNLGQAKKAYEWRLAKLREKPTDPMVRQEALDAGRAYASWSRHASGGLTTVYDEVALANDIEAACAAAQAPSAQDVSALSIEHRLERLKSLHAKNLISDEEYLAKRSEILAEL
ncbi:MAG TPA: SHOCT domain-containing protein [Thermoanaerobaculia bacterium]|nr:SHOCT domain-containing protein [Thermoanaerobaculia bacterium]